MNLGRIQFVSCHKMPERSFFYKGKQFPFCSRCTGIYIGYLTFPLFSLGIIYLNIWWTILLILPSTIDGLLQAYTKWESNNILRVIVGTIKGVGLMSLIALIGHGIGRYILTLIK